MCAIKYGPKSSQKQSTLILQEYVKDSESVITWNFYYSIESMKNISTLNFFQVLMMLLHISLIKLKI